MINYEMMKNFMIYYQDILNYEAKFMTDLIYLVADIFEGFRVDFCASELVSGV